MREAKTHGYVEIFDEAGKRVAENDVLACCHCRGRMHLIIGKDPIGGWCALCGEHHCKKPACSTCVPFEKQLEAMESRDRFLRAVG